MQRFEYDVENFALVEKWNQKKQAEKLQEMVTELNAKGEQGWELLGLHTFDLVGGIIDPQRVRKRRWSAFRNPVHRLERRIRPGFCVF